MSLIALVNAALMAFTIFIEVYYMRKHPYLLLFFAVIMLVFACEDFAIPSALVIKGSPNIRFTSQLDMGKRFLDMIGDFDDDGSYRYLDCVNMETITYMVIDEEDFTDRIYPRDTEDKVAVENSGPEGFLVGTDGTGKLLLLEDKESIYKIKKKELTKDFPDGFKFTGIKSKLFIYSIDSDVGDVLSFKLDFDGDGVPDKTLHNYGKNIPSGLHDIKEYKGRYIPEGGHDLELDFNDENEIVITLTEIYVEIGKRVYKEYFEHVEVYAEFMVWVPFELRALYDGAQIEIPSLFSEGNDLFGRGNPEDESPVEKIINTLMFSMNMNKNPFTGAFVAVDCKYPKTGRTLSLNPSPILNKSLSFFIDDDKMQEINKSENYPYSPKIYIRFNKDGIMYMPHDFLLTEIGFIAEINYRMGSD